MILAKGAVSWLSRMQAVTSSGTSEAGYIALSEAVKEILFLRLVQGFTKLSMRIGAVNVFEDNEGTIKLAVNKDSRRRTKHVDVKHHLGKDACDAGNVRVGYVRTKDQETDMFTKPQDIQEFH